MIFESPKDNSNMQSIMSPTDVCKTKRCLCCVSSEPESSTHSRRHVCSDLPVPSQRTVRFCSPILVNTGLGVTDFSREERQSYWYTNEELEDIGCEAVATVELMDINAFIEDEEYCSRGLESKTQRAIERVSQNRAVVYAAIARESFLRKYYGENAAGLRNSCWEIYAYDEESAHLRAVVDEEEAFRIFREDAAIVKNNGTS